jgi:D-tyrosyl-tRNA(Tyr) deacylase
MRVVIQRVTESHVTVDKKIVGSIDSGILLLVAFKKDDNINDIMYMIDKIINLRIFSDKDDKMNLSIKDINGSILSISQFTLYGDARKGRRPSYDLSLNYEEANKLYDIFNTELKNSGLKIETGIFGADMKVSLINDGPVTIIIDSKE